MSGPSLHARKLESITPLLPLGRKKTLRSSSPPPLVQGRLSHDRAWFYVSVMNLHYSKVKKRTEYVILGGGGVESNLVP